MEEILDNNNISFGKNPTLTFGEKYLIINEVDIFGKNSKRTIPLNEIKQINYIKPFHLGKFLFALIFIVVINDFPDYRPFLEITYSLDGEEAKTACNGRFNKNQLKAMDELISLKKVTT